MQKLFYLLACVAVGAFVLSPIDLIPDVFVGIGWIDDILLVLGLYYARKFLNNKKPSTKTDDNVIEVDFKDQED